MLSSGFVSKAPAAVVAEVQAVIREKNEQLSILHKSIAELNSQLKIVDGLISDNNNQ